MPIIKIRDKLVYFAHIPKCGGTSIEDYLEKKFGTVFFLDRNYPRYLENERDWNNTSPQHIDKKSLLRLIPSHLISRSFAVVRHPVSRISSVFKFQRDVQNRIPIDMSFSTWIASIERDHNSGGCRYDNHTLPATSLLIPGTTIFHFENGLSSVKQWLDRLDPYNEVIEEMPWKNKYEDLLKSSQKRTPSELVMEETDFETIARIYQSDFNTLGYNIYDTTFIPGLKPNLRP